MVEISPTGWAALYKADSGFVERAVERFDDDGHALVVDPQRGALVPAHHLSGFQFLTECARAFSVVPSQPGWRVVGVDDDYVPPVRVVEDVHAWLVADGGMGWPLIVNRESEEPDCLMRAAVAFRNPRLIGPGDEIPVADVEKRE
ncbi:hypothetical protein [Saccharopolyspora hattusasensis]|uniref:hypothetical protein n=1 Tax=Saccharopolyspora hattusasensis TaxID=1128679 RepID=UPI003D984D4D